MSRLDSVEWKLKRAADLAREIRRDLNQVRQIGWMVPSGGGVPCVITFVFEVSDLATGLPLAGASVLVTGTGGGTVASGTTGGTGLFVASAYAADTFNFTVSKSGYISVVNYVSVTCGNTVTIPVAIGSGVTVAWCSNAIPIVLHATESVYGAVVTLNWFSGAIEGTKTWVGCAMVAGTAGGAAIGGFSPHVACTAPAGGAPLFMILNGNTNPPKLTVWYEGNLTTACPLGSLACGSLSLADGQGVTGSVIDAVGAQPMTVAGCSPVHLTLSHTVPAPSTISQRFYPAGAMTVDIVP
jgi:hypothetical protein